MHNTYLPFVAGYKHPLSFALLSLALATGLLACGGKTPATNGEPLLGTLEVSFDLGQQRAQSNFREPVASAANAVLAANRIELTPTSFQVVDSLAVRYINASFSIKNNSNQAIDNLTLQALAQATGVGGTALKNISNFGGTAITSAAIAQAVKPSHGMSSFEGINNNQADLQAFSDSEASALEAVAKAANPAVIGVNDQLLGYGYVGRSGTGRSIAANGGTGSVTIALRIPKTGQASEPYRFAIGFIVTSNSSSRVTRAREETSAQAQTRLDALDASNKELLLVGPEHEDVNCNVGVVQCIDNAKTSSQGHLLYSDPATLATTVELVKDSLGVPWSLHLRPDGLIYYTMRDASLVNLNVLNPTNGTVTKYEASSSVRDESEGGVLGMDFDPDFASNNKVYICYSYYAAGMVANNNRRNRLSSFIVSGGALTNEQILYNDMLGWSNHNGCRVVVGPDQKLWFSMGDAANFSPGPIKAQDIAVKAGKIFRISRDGSIPSDNPDSNSAVWTLGHRNPQGLAFQPWSGRLWSTEHGQNTRDELNLIVKGMNYGWPRCVGNQAFGSSLNVSADGTTYTCTTDASTAPNLTAAKYKPAVKEYDSGSTVATSDIVFYNSNAFPEWRGHLFITTLKTGRLYRVTLNGEAFVSDQILINNQYGRVRDVTVGPEGFIYFSTDDGEIYRLKPG
jgi:aldose sugar dehydrogenase